MVEHYFLLRIILLYATVGMAAFFLLAMLVNKLIEAIRLRRTTRNQRNKKL